MHGAHVLMLCQPLAHPGQAVFIGCHRHYLDAAGRTTNLAEQRHLTRRAAALAAHREHVGGQPGA